MAASNGILDGVSATASSDSGPGYTADLLIDGDNNSIFHSGTGLPVWIQFDLGSGNAKASGNYKVRARSEEDMHYWIAWTLHGSNNGTDWDVLDSQTGQSFTLGEEKTFSCENPTPYRYYKFNITSTSSGSYAAAAELSIAAGIADADPACYITSRHNRFSMEKVSGNKQL